MRDTLIPAPTFDARQFERTFRFKRYMVRPINISKLVKHDSLCKTRPHEPGHNQYRAF
jgi:hypothetical protein